MSTQEIGRLGLYGVSFAMLALAVSVLGWLVWQDHKSGDHEMLKLLSLVAVPVSLLALFAAMSKGVFG